MTVAVLGASNNPDRTSFQAVSRLLEVGHQVFPVHPAQEEVLGLKMFHQLSDVPRPVDTLTLYVSAGLSDKLSGDILKLRPRRIIFNPGAENPALLLAANEAGIETLEACTLVMLSTGVF